MDMALHAFRRFAQSLNDFHFIGLKALHRPMNTQGVTPAKGWIFEKYRNATRA